MTSHLMGVIVFLFIKAFRLLNCYRLIVYLRSLKNNFNFILKNTIKTHQYAIL